MLGLDGCPGGWAAALVDDERVTWRHYDGWADGLREALVEDVACVAIDIPIGLPAVGDVRSCDAAARARLRHNRASVFFAPCRDLFGLATHAETTARSVALCGHGVSIQAYGIFGRIAAVDLVLRPADQARVVEVHPEIGFDELAGDLGSKHTREGRARREAALARVLPPFSLRDKPSRVKADDALDALVCAWSARRWLAGTAVLLPADPPRDARGLFAGIAA